VTTSHSQGYHLGLDSNNHDIPISKLFDDWVKNNHPDDEPSYKEFQDGFLQGYYDFRSRELTTLCWEIVNELQEVYSVHGIDHSDRNMVKIFELASDIGMVLIDT
jgi:hypothetical protein